MQLRPAPTSRHHLRILYVVHPTVETNIRKNPRDIRGLKTVSFARNTVTYSPRLHLRTKIWAKETSKSRTWWELCGHEATAWRWRQRELISLTTKNLFWATRDPFDITNIETHAKTVVNCSNISAWESQSMPAWLKSWRSDVQNKWNRSSRYCIAFIVCHRSFSIISSHIFFSLSLNSVGSPFLHEWPSSWTLTYWLHLDFSIRHILLRTREIKQKTSFSQKRISK